jgi:hypothetical protein
MESIMVVIAFVAVFILALSSVTSSLSLLVPPLEVVRGVEGPGTVAGPRVVEEPDAVAGPELVEGPDAVGVPKAAEGPDAAEVPVTVAESEVLEGPETVDESEAAEGPEPVERPEPVEAWTSLIGSSSASFCLLTLSFTAVLPGVMLSGALLPGGVSVDTS